MAILRCLICKDPVLGGVRWEVRFCGAPCATEALFEVVRLDAQLDASATDGDTTTGALFDDLGRVHRRQLLMHATLAWHELDELTTPGGVATPQGITLQDIEDGRVAGLGQ